MCYYYRDGPGGIGPKLRWRGPARVVMVEQLESGPHTTIYWVVHGTNLLRAAPEHLRPVPEQEVPKPTEDDPFYRAQQALQGVRSRGTTLYTDLTRTNKRQRHEASSDEEDEEFDEDLPDGDDERPGLADSWESQMIEKHGQESTMCQGKNSMSRRMTLRCPQIVSAVTV